MNKSHIKLSTNKSEDAYLASLEERIQEQEQKYKELYDSIRVTDWLIHKFKTILGPLYRPLRHLLKKDEKMPLQAVRERAVFSKLKKNQPNPEEQIAVLYAPSSRPRVNLVLNSFSSYPSLATKHLIVSALTQAKTESKDFRLITRQGLPDASILRELMSRENISFPFAISFYSDDADHISPPVRRLEVGNDETFIYEKREDEE